MLEQLEPIIKSLLETYAGKYGVVPQVLGILVAVRVINKSLQPLVRSIVQLTPTPRDNEILDKILASSWWKSFVWVLDLVASVKLPVKEKPEIRPLGD